MYEVVMKYNDIIKYFECYAFIGDLRSYKTTYILKSINEEMDDYIKNIISYNERNKKLDYYCEKSSDIDFNEYSKTFIDVTETVVFSFPDEETAFYFKLKYCSS